MKGHNTLILLLFGEVLKALAMHGTPYLDVEYNVGGEKRSGRITFELYWDITPKTARNFYEFVKGTEIGGKYYKYENGLFHRIIPGFMMQGGDVVMGNGSGSISIYNAEPFSDENFEIAHDSIGKLSMANRGPHTNGSQFFITFDKQHHLDGKHVVFGNVSGECLSLIRDIQKIDIDRDRPVHPVRIVRSGIVEEGEEKYL
ncbi:PEPTIDYL-PROLYL CIS-TRANS ISOMERASE (CYCLOPHILIN) [Encephalitozoon cuniculi GB-M1]|uniref:Peptidyl-prolyl cis-trans isomerase n=1 Tax=Encephalitozoon cuniculi (strain GB-M1) TaxID=284813 RepID=Q8SQZ8_ENCCU|nr:uncharacterized protein ECU10_1760 [Encephalitozoon cuniculi GB-M1]CAD25897.1 PEPTIDYL-PROLYL CIS-TRANS ISOMERASE (CYCLOPHILIN) [Encephalitozoon cuniculi GB-M1]